MCRHRSSSNPNSHYFPVADALHYRHERSRVQPCAQSVKLARGELDPPPPTQKKQKKTPTQKLRYILIWIISTRNEARHHFKKKNLTILFSSRRNCDQNWILVGPVALSVAELWRVHVRIQTRHTEAINSSEGRETRVTEATNVSVSGNSGPFCSGRLADRLSRSLGDISTAYLPL